MREKLLMFNYTDLQGNTNRIANAKEIEVPRVGDSICLPEHGWFTVTEVCWYASITDDPVLYEDVTFDKVVLNVVRKVRVK